MLQVMPRPVIKIDPALKTQLQSMRNLVDEKDKKLKQLEEDISKCNLKKTPKYIID